MAAANKTISALNWMYDSRRQPTTAAFSISSTIFFSSSPFSNPATDLRCSAAALRLLHFVFSSCADFIRRRGFSYLRGDEAAANALTAILRSSEFPSYGSSVPVPSSSRPSVPLRADEVSLPSSPPTCDLLSKLPEEVAAIYQDPANLLRADEAKQDLPRPYIGGSLAERTRLMQRMLTLGMVAFTTEPAVVNGLFPVPKPNGSQRLIIDARPANAVFQPPPPVSLPLPPDLAAMEASGPFFIAGLDVADFFHRLRLPAAYQPYFALPPVRGPDVGRTEEWVWPMCTTLPMGWSHSVFLAQTVHEHFLAHDPAMPAQPRIGRDQPVDPAKGAHVVYIDDFNMMHGQRDIIDSEFQTSRARYPANGLDNNTKKDVPPTQEAKVLGLVVNGRRGRLELPAEKCTQLILATQSLLSIGECSGHTLSKVIGHWTWFALVRRPALSVFNAAYQFTVSAGARVRRLWPSVRRELMVICDLAPLIWSSITNDWFDRAVAFDASTLAAGVCSAPASPSDIAAELHHVVRNGAAVVLDGVVEETSHHMPQASLEPPLHGARWATVIARPWGWDDHINVLEVQAALLAVRWVLSHPSAICARVLLFGDSQVALGCLAKGRSSSYRLLRLLRRVAALVLASGLRPAYRWLPSAANPADGPSRLQ